jgi:hypothetical protein
VVERQRKARQLAPPEPARVGGVVAAPRFPSNRDRVVEDGDRVAARIALRVGIDTANTADPHLDAGLLADLASTGLLRRLSRLAEAARERPSSLERRAPPSNEEKPPAPIPGPGVDREPGTLRGASAGHGRPELSKNSRMSSAGRREASSAGLSEYQSRGSRLA